MLTKVKPYAPYLVALGLIIWLTCITPILINIDISKPLPPPPPEPQRVETESVAQVLASNGLKSCETNPVTSYFKNQKVVRIRGQRYIVICDPMDHGIQNCCY